MAEGKNVQVIDEDKVFHPVKQFLSKTGLYNNGLDYHVVSVFGSQSTGKSTLLNGLFGTNFQVMDGSHRGQTTKGIWMSQAVDTSVVNEKKSQGQGLRVDSDSGSDDFVNVSPGESPSVGGSSGGDGGRLNILVLDVEGTDGRERGEDQDFERKSALFALATSEVLIVNMWENQVGLYQGANMGLLKTVFEVNLALFGKNKKKSVLLFVIRDYLGISALSDLANTVILDLQNQWQDITKPEGLENSRFEDYFDVQFYGLPHKILKPEQFYEQVGYLGKWFSDKQDTDNYIFNPIYHRGVPIDGWDMYASSIWDQIEQNKDLDLPTQQILVARFRCEEILALAWEIFEQGLLEAGLAGATTSGATSVSKHDPEFGKTITKLRADALEYFNATASRYHKAVYNEKLTELNSKIDAKLSLLFKTQLHLLSTELLTEFKQFKFDSTKKGYHVFENQKTALLEKYETAAKLASIDGTYNYTEERALFVDQLDELESTLKEQEVTKTINKCNKKLVKALADNLPRFFVSPTDKTWDEVLDFFNKTTAESADMNAFMSIGVHDVEKVVYRIRKTAWLNLDAKLKDIIREDAVISRLKDSFETKFKYDPDTNVPVVWTPTDDIQSAFVASRDSALELLSIFAEAKLSSGDYIVPEVPLHGGDDEDDEDEDDDESTDVPFYKRLSDIQKEEISRRFKMQADSVYVDTKRAMTQTSSQIPTFVFVIIVVLGWNEFMAVIRNPFLFVFSLMIAGGFYVVHTLHMWGPVITVTNTMTTETLNAVKAKLREVLEVPESVSAELHPARPAIGGGQGSGQASGHSSGGEVKNEAPSGEVIEMDTLNKMPGSFY